jgi:transglutaminase-like putative cysteine protease
VVTVAFKNMFYRGRRQYSHVYAQVREPRTGRWITLDPVAGDRTKKMRGDVVAAKVWPVV